MNNVDSLLDDALYPPMEQEELDMLDGILLGLKVVPTGQGEHQKQENQQDQHQHQQPDPDSLHLSHPHPHKLDLPTGRVGDPPGLDSSLGSSQQQQVPLNGASSTKTDFNEYPPMNLDEVE